MSDCLSVTSITSVETRLNAATATISEVDSVTLDEPYEPILAELAEAGIDMHQVTEDLLDAGIEAFIHSLDGLIEGIEKQRPGGSA